jgi:hypothetical protein
LKKFKKSKYFFLKRKNRKVPCTFQFQTEKAEFHYPSRTHNLLLDMVLGTNIFIKKKKMMMKKIKAI